MGQDKNAEGEYRTGYGGYGRYTTPQQPGDATSGQQYGQQGSQQQFQQQEYADSTYQAPRSTAPAMNAYGPTTTPLSARIEALLGYGLWWVGGLFFFLIERKNRFVRFHAAQSIIFFGGVTVLLAVLQLISIIPLLGFILAVPISFALNFITIVAVIVWLFMMIQMYRGKNVRIPIVSGYAESLLDRFTSKKKKSTM